MNRKWLKVEFKRAAAALPAVAAKAAVIAALISVAIAMVLFCASRFLENESVRVHIGYVAQDDAMVEMLVSYVRETDTVRAFCDIERMESRDEALELLREGEIDVLLELPENIVEEIVSGSNAPAVVYMPEGDGVFSSLKWLIFSELADTAVGLLQTAQAEIYATEYIVEDSGTNLNELYSEIDAFNLRLVADRESLFKSKNISAVGSDTYAVYYGSAILALYVLLIGMLADSFYCMGKRLRSIARHRLCAGVPWQVCCSFIAGLLLMVVLFVIGILPVFIAGRLGFFELDLDLRLAVLGILAAAFMSVYFMLICRIFGDRRRAFAAVGILAILQGYMSGCFVPSALLPDLIQRAGAYLPAAYLKKAFTVWLSGSYGMFSSAVWGLLIWTVLLLLLNIVLAFLESSDILKAQVSFHKQAYPRAQAMPTVLGVVFRRMVLRRGVLAVVLIMAFSSLLIEHFEGQSDTSFTAAVYDGSGVYKDALSEHDGLVDFVICEDENEVEELVLRGRAECGYVLPADLQENILNMRAAGNITVYKGADSVCAPLVNEVIFGVLFDSASLAWYENFMSGYGASADFAYALVSEQIELGKTFGTRLVTVSADGTEAVAYNEAQTTYPVETVAAVAVAICGIQGLLTAVWDWRKGRYRRKGRMAVALATILVPVLFASLCASFLKLIFSGKN